MSSQKPPSQLELEFAPKREEHRSREVIDLASARVRIEHRKRGALYESIISRAAHLLTPASRTDKKNA